MSCPWYISARAVREYLALTGQPPVTDGPAWDRAERELMAMAEVVARQEQDGVKAPRPVLGHPDLVQYRGGRPLRPNLIVSRAARPEGELPQLVSVVPSGGGAGGWRR